MTRRSGVVVREKAGALTCTFSIFLFMLSFSPITNSEFERKNPIFENDFETWILIFWAVNVGEITVIYDSLETCRTQEDQKKHHFFTFTFFHKVDSGDQRKF